MLVACTLRPLFVSFLLLTWASLLKGTNLFCVFSSNFVCLLPTHLSRDPLLIPHYDLCCKYRSTSPSGTSLLFLFSRPSHSTFPSSCSSLETISFCLLSSTTSQDLLFGRSISFIIPDNLSLNPSHFLGNCNHEGPK